MLTYPKVRQLGDPIVAGILDGEVLVEEKYDGSALRVHIDTDGTMQFGSHHIDYTDSRLPDKMFCEVIEIAKKQFNAKDDPPTQPVDVFAEMLSKPKQNTLCYERVPLNKLVVFDVKSGDFWLDWKTKKDFAEHFDFEVAQKLFLGNGKDLSIEKIKELLQTTSTLGKTKIEGIVVKNYNKYFDAARYPWYAGFWLVGKYVREEFKEANRANWKNIRKGPVETLVESLRTEARWNKAVQRLREESKLTNTPKDIPEIMRAVVADIEEEEGEAIKKALWEHYWKSVKQGVVKGIPEWWKEKMLENL